MKTLPDGLYLSTTHLAEVCFSVEDFNSYNKIKDYTFELMKHMSHVHWEYSSPGICYEASVRFSSEDAAVVALLGRKTVRYIKRFKGYKLL